MYRNKDRVETHYRFCQLPFDGESSPFVLGCIYEYHTKVVSCDKNVKAQLQMNTYVNNVIGFVADENQVQQFGEEVVKIMEKGKFPLTNQSSDILQHSQNRPTGDRWLKL